MLRMRLLLSPTLTKISLLISLLTLVLCSFSLSGCGSVSLQGPSVISPSGSTGTTTSVPTITSPSSTSSPVAVPSTPHGS